MADLEGRTLGRYELRQMMGHGGMADVYLAYDPHFEREVAVKVFKREDEDLLRRFIREAQLMASLSNAHLMPVYDTGASRLDNANIYYIVMPFMDGGTLRTRVRRGKLSLEEASRYLADIADALDYMHSQGIIHRDIKSSNILLDADGHCYLSDFGIARTSTDATQLTSTGNVLGTVDYIAPELFETHRRADARSDYYSLGILLYEMVTGHLPFTAENQIAVVAMHVSKQPPFPRQFVPDLPPNVERVMLRSLEKRPELRYGSALELADAFSYAVHHPVTVDLSAASAPYWDRDDHDGPTLRQQQTFSRVQRLPPSTVSRTTQRGQAQPQATGDYAAQNYYPASQQSALYPAYAQQDQYASYRQRENKAVRTQTRVVTISVIIVLLLIVVPMTYVLLTHTYSFGTGSMVTATATPNLQETSQASTTTAQQAANAAQTASANTTATAQAQATATQLAHQQATATALAEATATAEANATATPAVLQTAIAGSPVYQDALNNSQNAATQAAQWDQGSECVFQSDGYHVQTGLFDSLHGCHEANKQFENFAAQVDVTIQQGTSAGIFFRMNTTSLGSYQGYLFQIDTNGRYKISSSSNFSTANSTVLQNWTASPVINQGASQNTLEVIANGSKLLFYANGAFLGTTIQDQTFSSGTLGFLATANNGDKADIVYNNLSVYPV
ncbi:MAG TPA: serine/threonine-protein kinase [Dictyobacter sp.]|jgi:serine/threonine protein kinase|nr:serine/threonine-protein kinase [Dictyobacter sp.]